MATRRDVLYGTAALAAVGLTPKSTWAQSSANEVLNYGLNSEVSALDPHVYVGSAAKDVNLALYNGLVTFDQSGKIVPDLAESWTVENERAYVFKLRKNVKYHGGQSFSAKDVEFSFKRILDPATGATLRSNLLGLSVTVVDESTVRLEKPEVDASLLSVIAMPEAAIISSEWMRQNPNVKLEANGTGPFKLQAHEPRVRIEVVKNDSYFNPSVPYLKRIIFKSIPNSDARVNALRTKSVDMIEFVPWKDIGGLKAQPDLEVSTAVGSFMNIWYNVAQKPFDNPLVRQAIGFAIDREVLAKIAFFGFAKPLNGPPTEGASTYFNPELANYFKYDLAHAKRLLERAGYPKGFEFELICWSGLDIFPATAQLVQASLQQIGVNAKIKLVEFANMIDAKNRGQYQAMVYGVSVKLPDPDTYSYYFGADSTYWAKSAGFNDPEVEALLQKGRASLSVEDRKPIYQSLQKRILELSPWTFLVWRDQAQAYRRGITGFKQLEGALNESGPGIAFPLMKVGS